MKNKKGFLLAEETLKILIAVISISFLVYFLTALYFAKMDEQDKKHAEATLDRISIITNSIQNTTEFVYDPTPEGWSLFGFVGEEMKPNKCAGENCLCICDSVVDVPFVDRQLNECDEDGFCKLIRNLKYFEEIEIKESPFALEIKKENETDKIIIQVK